MPNTNSIKLSVSVRKTNTARCCKTDKAGAIEKSNDFKLTDHRQEKRADTRLLAQALGLKHRSLFEQVESYKADFEAFGVVRFQTDQPLPSSKGGRPERFALPERKSGAPAADIQPQHHKGARPQDQTGAGLCQRKARG